MLKTNEKGQSLIEVLVVGVISAIMIIALIVIILNSLKNAQFAQNQTMATKYAQDAIDKIRILRDGNKEGSLLPISGSSSCFKELWNSTSGTDFDCTPDCYYQLNTGSALQRISTSEVNLTGGFSRQVKVNQDHDFPDEAMVTVTISWTDSSGAHSSILDTIITKPNYECSN